MARATGSGLKKHPPRAPLGAPEPPSPADLPHTALRQNRTLPRKPRLPDAGPKLAFRQVTMTREGDDQCWES